MPVCRLTMPRTCTQIWAMRGECMYIYVLHEDACDETKNQFENKNNNKYIYRIIIWCNLKWCKIFIYISVNWTYISSVFFIFNRKRRINFAIHKSMLQFCVPACTFVRLVTVTACSPSPACHLKLSLSIRFHRNQKPQPHRVTTLGLHMQLMRANWVNECSAHSLEAMFALFACTNTIRGPQFLSPVSDPSPSPGLSSFSL